MIVFSIHAFTALAVCLGSQLKNEAVAKQALSRWYQMVDGGISQPLLPDSLPEERLLLPLRPFLASASTSAVLGSYFNSTLTAYAPVASDSLKTFFDFEENLWSLAQNLRADNRTMFINYFL